MTKRITETVDRGEAITLTLNGEPVSACAGETLATVLLAEGLTAFNRTGGGDPRGPWCNIGTCFECQVRVMDAGSSTARWLRACITPAEAGMVVTTSVRLLQNSDHAAG